MITHRNLKYALKLAEIGNYRRTAEALHITHSALVRGIKTLENYLEIRLFDRGGGVKVTPTDIGLTFLEHARKVTLAEGDLLKEIQAQVGLEKGILRVAMGPFPSKICGHAAIGRLLRRHGTLKFKVGILQYSKIMGAILDREIDIGISELGEAVKNEELRTEPLGEHIGVFLCRPGHPLFDRRSLTISDLLDFPWCCTRMPSRFTDHLPTDLGLAAETDPLTGELVPAIEVDVISDVTAVIANSDALCPSALLMFREELDAGTVSVIPFHQPWMVTNYGFVSLKHRTFSPIVLAFMDTVRKVEQELFAEEERFAKSIKWNP